MCVYVTLSVYMDVHKKNACTYMYAYIRAHTDTRTRVYIRSVKDLQAQGLQPKDALRGHKGTKVTLTVKSSNGSKKSVTLTRSAPIVRGKVVRRFRTFPRSANISAFAHTIMSRQACHYEIGGERRDI